MADGNTYKRVNEYPTKIHLITLKFNFPLFRL